ncbi:MAG: LysR family transcriptional regulator [Solirubrobacteraceae bacterium]
MSEQHRWLGVEIRHLAALEAVITARSFAGAARRLGYTQSAISLQIATLERIAETRLLERPGGRRPIVPTPAGERVLRHARRVLDQIHATEADLTDLATGEAGTISLGTFQSASRRLLPDALRRLHTTYPAIEVRLDETPHQEQLERLATGQTDLAFVLLPVDGPFETRELVDDPFLFIAARQSPQPDDRLPSLAQLARLPLISWQRAPFVLEALLHSRGHHPHVVLRSDDSATVQALVAAGLGSAVLPSFALDLPDPRLVVLDAGRHLPPRRIGLAWHRDRVPTAAIHALIETLESASAQLKTTT